MNVQIQPDSLIALQRPLPQTRHRRHVLQWTAAAIAVLSGFTALYFGVPRRVEMVVVALGPLALERRGPGTLDAINRVALGARTPGRLTEVLVDRNDRVVAGQIVARLDPGDLLDQLAAAEANSRAIARAVEVSEAERERALATLANARGAYDRQKALMERGFASQAALDTATASFRQAQADLNRIERLVEQSQAEAHSARAKADVTRVQIDDMVLKAPFEGVVVSRDRNPGDMMTSGQAILQLVDPKTIVLTARFDESSIAAIHPGQPSRITFASQPDEPVAGRVLRLSRSVDTETREFSADIVPERLPVNWAIGQRGTASVEVGLRDKVISVPKELLARRDGAPGLWVEVDGRARWREVELGASNHLRVEIRNGVTAGERVLEPSGLFPFMPVTAREPGT